MEIVRDIPAMRRISARERGKRIGFVPTMGFLHDGHLSLVEHALKGSGFVVVSIFVNPLQFGPSEDFQTYPRDEEKDIRLLEEGGVHCLFSPPAREIYPPGFSTIVDVGGVSSGLCGARRPGHFKGVATVVLKLLHIVDPDVAYFGEKDYQQLLVIKRMVQDLDMPVEIVPLPTLREGDGLAMSSRNRYLKRDEREIAPTLYRALLSGREMWKGGEKRAGVLIREMRRFIEREGGGRIVVDYLEICDPSTLVGLERVEERGIILIAAFIGRARLIDNLLLH